MVDAAKIRCGSDQRGEEEHAARGPGRFGEGLLRFEGVLGSGSLAGGAPLETVSWRGKKPEA